MTTNIPIFSDGEAQLLFVTDGPIPTVYRLDVDTDKVFEPRQAALVRALLEFCLAELDIAEGAHTNHLFRSIS